MNQYLIETFQWNDGANRKVLEKIRQLPDKNESIKFFSHLINSMNKWMARLKSDANLQQMDWWIPAYPLDELEPRWNECLLNWISFLESKTEEELLEPARFTGLDGGQWEAKPKDIALQLNYHSIHHRAQIQTMIRQQGLQPDFVDYIGTVYRKIS
ncbi:MAG: DinB family protein [Chitinophagales bacterium]